MSKYLRVTFSDNSGTKRSIRVKDPKDGITSDDINTFVNQVVGLNLLLTKNGTPVTKGISAVVSDSSTVWEAQ
jgi:hypothetical protein